MRYPLINEQHQQHMVAGGHQNNSDTCTFERFPFYNDRLKNQLYFISYPARSL